MKNYTLSEVLELVNNNKEFMCLANHSIVKNIEGTLYLATKTGFVNRPKEGNTVILDRTYKDDKWSIASASSVWVNAEYEPI